MKAMEGIDRSIVQVLMEDGRISFTDLADRVGLSVSATHQRVRRLEQRGIIRGYNASVDFAQLGLSLTAFIAIRSIDGSDTDEIPHRLSAIPEIEACYSVAGDDNYLVRVRVSSPEDLEDILRDIRTKANCVTRTTVVLSTPYEGRLVRAPRGHEDNPILRH